MNKLPFPFFDPAQTEPQRVLSAMMALREWNGVPVLIVNPDDVPHQRGQFETYMMNRIDEYADSGAAAVSSLKDAFHFYEDDLRIQLFTVKNHYGFSPPVAAIYPNDLPKASEAGSLYAPIDAAIILAPETSYAPELDLQYGLGASRRGADSLLLDSATWRLLGLCHELAHVAGAGEPQADLIAGLLCRKATGENVTPVIQSDLRAVEAVVTATEIASGKTSCMDHHMTALKEYGWAMVQANDAVMTVSEHDLQAMDQAHILTHRFDVYDQSPDRLLTLGALAHQAGLSRLLTAKRTDSIARGADRFASAVTSLTQDTEIRTMVERFALAARRLDAGSAAYAPQAAIPESVRNSPAPVFFPLLRPFERVRNQPIFS